MKSLRLLAVVLLAVLSACTWRPDPDRHANQFFDEGRDMIIKAIEKQDASDQQVKAAEAVLARHQATLPGEIATVMRAQRDLFRAVVTGQGSATLERLETALHQVHASTARSIGRMHEEIGTAVGATVWQGAQAHLEQRWARRFRE